jgi:hypothetical protein
VWPFKKAVVVGDQKEPEVGPGVDYPTCVPVSYLEEYDNDEENQAK